MGCLHARGATAFCPAAASCQQQGCGQARKQQAQRLAPRSLRTVFRLGSKDAGFLHREGKGGLTAGVHGAEADETMSSPSCVRLSVIPCRRRPSVGRVGVKEGREVCGRRMLRLHPTFGSFVHARQSVLVPAAARSGVAGSFAAQPANRPVAVAAPDSVNRAGIAFGAAGLRDRDFCCPCC